MKKIVSLLLLATAATGVIAEEPLIEDEIPEIRRYTVEMIIFSYAQNASAGSEIFVPDAPPPVDLLDDLGIDGDSSLHSLPEIVPEPEPEIDLQAELEETTQEYELVMLAEEDFQLVDAYEHLRRLDAYEPLLHFGWTQPTFPEEDTESRPLSSFVTLPDGLEGEISLYLSRYLHLVVKLQLDAPTEDAATDDAFDNAAPRRDFNDGYADYSEDTISYPVRYRIDEDRIFRNGELRYYDHPKFGVLAKVSRAEEEELEEELPEDGEMLGDIELLDGE
jgi:hypothetical protein